MRATHWKTYFHLSKLKLSLAIGLKAFESKLQWSRMYGTFNHFGSVMSWASSVPIEQQGQKTRNKLRAKMSVDTRKSPSKQCIRDEVALRTFASKMSILKLSRKGQLVRLGKRRRLFLVCCRNQSSTATLQRPTGKQTEPRNIFASPPTSRSVHDLWTRAVPFSCSPTLFSVARANIGFWAVAKASFFPPVHDLGSARPGTPQEALN